MKYYILLFILTIFFISCSKQPEIIFESMPKTKLLRTDIKTLPNWKNEHYKKALESFKNSCRSKRTFKIYKDLCTKAKKTKDIKKFFVSEFTAYKLSSSNKQESGLLTGYYEASLRGSLVKKVPYIYPVYEKPKDLIVVELSSVYPELKNYRLRGRLVNGKLIPYYTREEFKSNTIDAKVICYVNSKIDLFFLEVQGSGRVNLDNGDMIYLGFSNQNGHKYKSIGKYLINKDEISKKNISLQSIKAWLKKHPSRIDELLNYNKSMVFFKKQNHGASGSLGLSLTPNRSIAVDKFFIPLGSMLYLDSSIDKKHISRIVMAEDTGGAIKGALRADIFLGFGNKAMLKAGKLKSDLNLWILMPKEKEIN
ncbi:MAG: transglycosylase [Sulfurimonas sp.]|nr:MAG: transglycosylase [Sulfurimonas sp.]